MIPPTSEHSLPLLAFDCAGSACSAALLVGSRVLAWKVERRTRGQAERLLPLLEEVLAEGGVTWDEVGRLAVTRGPGSFTGVRIGLATARALALASGAPLFGLDNLSLYAAMVREKMAEEERVARRLLVAIDARRADIFIQSFDPAGKPLDLPSAALPEAVAKRLGAERWLLAGDGAQRLEPLFADRNVEVVPDSDVADPRTLARWAESQPLAAASTAPAPLYLRPPDVTLAKARQ